MCQMWHIYVKIMYLRETCIQRCKCIIHKELSELNKKENKQLRF